MLKAGLAVAMALLAGLAGGGQVRAGKPASVLAFVAGGDVVEASPDGSRALRISLPAPAYANSVAPSPDGHLLALDVTNGRRETLEVRSSQDAASVWTLALPDLLIGQPVWSGDSRRFAFTLDVFRLEVATVAGRHVRQIAAGVNVNAYAWSPSGQKLAFATRDRVAVYDVGSGRTTTLARTGGGNEVAWTPNGQTVVFIDRQDRLTVALAGSSERPQTVAQASQFALSPDGSRVAYWNFKGFFVSQLSPGAHVTRITPDVIDVAWSPDSRMIAFSRDPANFKQPRIYLAGRDGGSVRVLTPSDPDGGSHLPVFSPDGSKLAYVERSDGASRIRVLDLRRNSVAVLLADDPAGSDGAVWTTTTRGLPKSQQAVPLGADEQLAGGYRLDWIDGLAADAGQVAALDNVSFDPTYSNWNELLWSPASNSHALPPLACHDDVTGLTVAAGRLAYLCGVESGEVGVDVVDVYLASFGQTAAPKSAFSVPCCDVSLAGSGSLLAAAEGPSVYRIEPSGAQTLLRSYPAPVYLLGANAGRILVAADGDTLDVLDADGALVSELHLAFAAGAVLAGDQLAALDQGKLVIETLTGQPVAQRTLPADAQLEGLSDGVVAYTHRLRQHLLRLSDGRDLPVALAGQFEQSYAVFDSDGSLFYAFNTRWPTSIQLFRLSPDRIAHSLER